MLGGLLGFCLVVGLVVVGLIGVDGVVGFCVIGFVCDDCLDKVSGLVGEYVFDLWVGSKDVDSLMN